MSTSGYIHGGSDEREVARLEKQARFISARFHPLFDASPNDRVLDLATGVGAMAGQLLERFPKIHLVGVDLRFSQLRHAHLNHPGAHYIQANGEHLPFPDDTFDRVHCSWLLEHVPRPLPILQEVRRVLRPGGYCLFIEVDNDTFKTVPPFEEVKTAMDALNREQIQGGGDPFVGRRLPELFRSAGFSRVDTRPNPMVGDSKDPTFFQAFIDEFAEIFESTDEAVHPELVPLMHSAAARLRSLPSIPGSSIHYQSVVARGEK